MNRLSSLIILLFISLSSYACDYTISLFDTWGDGWNGNSLTIYVNGVNVLDGLTVASGNGPTTYNFSANDGQTVQIVYNPTGSYTSENEYTVYDFNNSVVAEDGMNDVTPTGVTFTASCPAPTCNDGWWNGNEQYIDCGGPDCPPCPQCGNGIMDADEEGVDCGGANCPACPTDWNINAVNGTTINTCVGTLYDSGGPSGAYANNENYSVTICSATGDPIMIDIALNGEGCCDHLIVYDGPTTASTQLADMIGNGTGTFSVTNTFISTGSCITIKWTSDGSVTNGGFTIDISCYVPSCTDNMWNGDEEFIDCGGPDCPPCPQCGNGVQDADEEGVDCGGANCPECPTDWNIDDINNQTIYTCGGTLYDPGGPNGDYGNSENYTATFCSADGGPLIMNVAYNGEGCCDHIYVHDGTSTGAPQIADIIGNSSDTYSVTQMFISTGSCLTIHWTSDGSVTYDGFIINFSCDMNYEPCDAWSLTPSMSCNMIQVTNVGATGSSVPPPPCGNYNGGDVWFEVTVPSSGVVTANTSDLQITDAAMALYTGPDCNNLTLIDCDDNSSGNAGMPWISNSSLIPGSTVWIRIWDEGGDQEGTFEICILDNQGPPQCDTGSPLASDFCGTATPICTFNGYCGNTSDTYTSSEVPSGFCGSVENNSWLSFVAAETSVTLNVWTSNCTMNSGIQMEIYQTSDCSNFTSVSNCVSDGTPSDFSIQTDVPLVVGETYYLMIDGYGGDNCDYVIQAAEGVMLATAISLDTGTGVVGICSGASTQLQASGGDTYLWTPATGLDDPTSASPFATPTTTTTYTVSVSGGMSDCPSSATAEVTVYVTEGFTISGTSTDITCYGYNDGSASITAMNGVEPYTYSWSDGSTTDALTALAPGTYSVTVSDTTGCVLDESFTINEPDSIQLQLSATEAITGTNTGTATVDNIINAIGSTSLLWSDGQTTTTATALAAQIYCVTVTDANGCTGEECVDVGSVGNPQSGFTYNGDQCFNGHLFNFTNTGTPPGPMITYAWTFDQGTPATDTLENPTGITWAAPGVYAVTQTVTQGGLWSDTVIYISVFEEPTIDITSIDPLCFGGTDGSATVVHLTGTAPYIYAWDAATGNQTTQTAINLGDGTYYVTVTDANGCTVVGSVKLFEPPQLVATTAFANAHCDNNDGWASITVLGGTPGYSYVWSAGGNINDSLNTTLVPGFYDVVVTDNNGCSLSETVNVGNTQNVVTTITAVANVSCNGYCDGAITAEVSGNGLPDFTYTWSDGNTVTSPSFSSSNNGLCAGYYRVTITDMNNCSSADSVSITEPTPLVSTISGVNVNCFGGSDGSIDLEVSGGTPPYTYLWNSGQVTQDIGNLTAGAYSVEVNDFNSCSIVTGQLITEPPTPVSGTSVPTDVSCFGGSDGKVNLTPSGGTPPYTYLWSNSMTTQDVDNLVAGTYTVVITDFNGCTYTKQETVGQPAEIIFATLGTPATCFGEEDGIAEASIVSGGIAPFTFVWSNGLASSGNSSMIDGLAAGIYLLTITDANSCSQTTSVKIFEPDKVVVSTSGNITICKTNSTTLSASGTGGTPNYTFYWSTGATGSAITVTPEYTKSYNVYAIDASGCESLPVNVLVTVLLPIKTELNADPDSICEGWPVDLSATTSGGLPPYTYSLNNGVFIENVNIPMNVYPEITTLYTLTVSDECGSPVGIDSAMVFVMDAPPNSFTSNVEEGCAPLQVNFNETNLHQGQKYEWDFGDIESLNYSELKNPSHTFATPGVYDITLTVTSPFGCIQSVTNEEMITVHEVPVADFDVSVTTTHIYNPDVQFTNLSTGADIFYWYFGDGYDTINSINPLYTFHEPGEYEVTLIVESIFGCRDTIKFPEINILTHYSFYAPDAFTPDGSGMNEYFTPFIYGLSDAESIEGEEPYTLEIYDRWGHKVFKTNTYSVGPDGEVTNGWNGKIYGRKVAPTNVYLWRVVYYDKAKTRHEKHGTVTVIR